MNLNSAENRSPTWVIDYQPPPKAARCFLGSLMYSKVWNLWYKHFKIWVCVFFRYSHLDVEFAWFEWSRFIMGLFLVDLDFSNCVFLMGQKYFLDLVLGFWFWCVWLGFCRVYDWRNEFCWNGVKDLHEWGLPYNDVVWMEERLGLEIRWICYPL